MALVSQKNRKKARVMKIKIEGERNNGQEVRVRHETLSQKRELSTWSWHEEFTVEWSETFLTTKRNPRGGGR